jgi:Gram-negative bacterial TonB protein C-terminal
MHTELASRKSMKTVRAISNLLLASIAIPLQSYPAKAIRLASMGSAGVLYLHESGAGAPLGKLNVSAGVMAGHCITMVSPIYPATSDDLPPTASTVVLRVVIWKSGDVSPMRVISGPPLLEDSAMNSVRLWHYKPFLRDGEPLDVTTDIRVDFDPGKPGGIVTHPHH